AMTRHEALRALGDAARCFTESKSDRSDSIYLNGDSDFAVNRPGWGSARRSPQDRTTRDQQHAERRRQMTKVSLSDFAAKILRNGRISFGDAQRLQRDILPDGLTSREEAEILIGLDRGAAKADAAWGRWLAATLVDFVVWGERPTGIVD